MARDAATSAAVSAARCSASATRLAMLRGSLCGTAPAGRALAADVRGARALCAGPPARLALFLAIARPVLTVPSRASAAPQVRPAIPALRPAWATPGRPTVPTIHRI
jgi:hypothetical protein